LPSARTRARPSAVTAAVAMAPTLPAVAGTPMEQVPLLVS